MLKNSVIQVENDEVVIDFDEPRAEGEQIDLKHSLKYETFVKITNMLIYHLRQHEETGIKKSLVIQWYLEQIESEIETEAEYLLNKKQVTCVIERLVTRDSILFEIKEDGDEESNLIVNPNYQSKD